MVQASVRPGILLAVPFLAASLVALGGCAGGKSAEDKQLDDLREELSKVQLTSDKFEERLDRLEVDTADGKHGDPTAEPAKPLARSLSAPMATPQLRVVRVDPEGSAESASSETAGATDSADPNDATPRPTIKIEGQGGDATITDEKGHRVHKASNNGAHMDHIEETLPPVGPDGANGGGGAGQPSALDANARRSYESALGLVNAKRYGEALEAFSAFLVRWPDHPNADNAMFWRGECYLAQGDTTRAAEQYEGVLARFPLGNKVPDALLKLGLARQKLGDPQAAKAAFDRLRRDFPHSDAARRLPAPEVNP